MAIRLLALLLFFLFTVGPALADQPPLGWLSGRADSSVSGTAPTLLTAPDASAPSGRVITSGIGLVGFDNGPGNTYTIDLSSPLLYFHNTGATTNQTALNAFTNIAGRATGDIFYWNGTNFTRLPIGSVSDVLTVAAGLPSWAAPTNGAPQAAHYITTQSDGTLTNEHVLGNGDGTTATVGAGTAVVDVDSTVIRTTGAQSMSGPKTLSGGPIVSGAQTTGLVLQGATNTTTIKTDPGSDRIQTIPDVADGSFIMTQGASTKVGALTLSASPVLSTDTITGSGANTVTLFTSSDTVVGKATSDVLTNKELTSPSLTSNATGLVMKGSGSNTFVHTWSPGGAGQTLTWPDPNGNVDVGYKTGTIAAGGSVYGIGNNTMSATAAGTSGQVLVSAGTSAPGWGAAPIIGGGTNNASLGVSALGIYNGDGSKVVQTTGSAGQSWRVNGGGSAVEAFTPGTVTSFSATPTGIFDVATATSTPALSLDNQSANTFLSGPASGSAATPSFRVHAIGDYIAIPAFNGGRLTLTTASPVADAAAQGTIYWTPYKHGVISLWDGAQYVNVIPGEKSLSLTATSGSVYDVFGYLSGGTLALESLVWTNTTTRATGLTVDSSGVTHKTGDQTRRHLGTFYASGTNQCTDNSGIRGLWNRDNRVVRVLASKDTTDSWTYTTAAFREINAGTTPGISRVNVVSGDSATSVSLHGLIVITNSNATLVSIVAAIGLDSTTARATDSINGSAAASATSGDKSIQAIYSGIPGVGLHVLSQLEYSVAAGTTTWYGDGGLALVQTGMNGTVEM